MIQLVKEWTVAEDDDMTFKHPPIKKSWVAYKIRKKKCLPFWSHDVHAPLLVKLVAQSTAASKGIRWGGLSGQPFQLQDISKLVYNIL